MKIQRNTEDAESRRFWEFVDRVAEEVAKWPAWMKGGPFPEAAAPPPPKVTDDR